MENDEVSLEVPKDNNAEKSVLGSVLISSDPIDTMDIITQILDPNDFFYLPHKLIFEAMIKLEDDKSPIDQITLINELNKNNQIDNIGGEEYLIDLAVIVPIASNAEYYAKIIKEKSKRRQIIKLLQNATKDSFIETDNIENTVDKISQGLDEVNNSNNNNNKFKEISDVLDKSFEQIDINAHTKGNITGLASGYPELDSITTGFGKGEMIIVAARPAVGKTAFALNIAKNVARNNPKLPVVIFSLEMLDVDIVNRLISATGSIDSQHMRTGNLTDQEWEKLTIAIGELSNTKIFIDDTPGIRINDIRSKLRHLQKIEGEIGLVIIDYLQLIEGNSHENRQQEVSSISRTIKKMAMELNTPIIALSQLSRGVEQRQDKRPIMSDIRESGSIEQDADIVSFLYRDDYYRKNDEDEDEVVEPSDNNISEVEILIEKNRRGARGNIKLLFLKAYNNFSNFYMN